MQLALLLTGLLLTQPGTGTGAIDIPSMRRPYGELPGAQRPEVKVSADAVTLTHCLISLSEEAQVPAKEGGQLTKIHVKDGDQVTKDQLLAQIDDAHSQMEYRAAERKYVAAKVLSENDINVQYSEAAADVAAAQVLTGEEANRRVRGSVTEAQMREWRLMHRKFLLEIKQARFKMQTDSMEAEVRKAEMDAAQENIDRRQIKAPLGGVVVDLKHHEGEWLQPGDTVLRILRVDRLRIEGFLKASEYDPAELANRPVTVTVTLAHGRQEKFQGKVIFVNPTVEAGGEFRVRVEVLNRKENDFWLLRPGQTAEMTIHTK
jgi:macrolide-specific efflux system membrane fusion protein